MPSPMQAFGISSSPFRVSEALSNLGISHTVVSGQHPASTVQHRFIAKEQPAWPVVLSDTKQIGREWAPNSPQVLFICASLAELSESNLLVLPMGSSLRTDLEAALKYAILHPLTDWKYVNKPMPIKEYVNIATKPSYMNDFQNLLYKITPYALQKEVQSLVIMYLGGMGSRATLLAKLKSSHKLDNMLALIKRPKTLELVSAVARLRRMNAEERERLLDKLCLETGFESFELMYVMSSSSNMKAAIKAKN